MKRLQLMLHKQLFPYSWTFRKNINSFSLILGQKMTKKLKNYRPGRVELESRMYTRSWHIELPWNRLNTALSKYQKYKWNWKILLLESFFLRSFYLYYDYICTDSLKIRIYTYAVAGHRLHDCNMSNCVSLMHCTKALTMPHSGVVYRCISESTIWLILLFA